MCQKHPDIRDKTALAQSVKQSWKLTHKPWNVGFKVISAV